MHIVRDKGTERPHSNQYNQFSGDGTYLCRRCGLALFRSHHKFTSACGWPSFDDELPNTIKRQPDADGRRTEVLCQRCDAHLGHVFVGEGLTQKNLRHCINSLAVEFVPSQTVLDTEEAIYAAGCFWGVQTLINEAEGVLNTEVGYTGGDVASPSYQQVCSKTTGHLEAVRVVYDTAKTDFETLTRLFFEIHNPTQHDGQGPDIGNNYLSAIFYFDESQKSTAEKLIALLQQKGLDIATQLRSADVFWPAEEYHQDYYQKTGGSPYCHIRMPRFDS